MYDVYFIFCLINIGFMFLLYVWFFNRGLIILMILYYFGVIVLCY